MRERATTTVHMTITVAHICGLTAYQRRETKEARYACKSPKEGSDSGQGALSRPYIGLEASTAAQSLCPQGQSRLTCECVEQLGVSAGRPAKEQEQVGRNGPKASRHRRAEQGSRCRASNTLGEPD